MIMDLMEILKNLPHVVLMYVLPFLVILTVLVFVHEMGHYLVARRNGVKVEVFSIGFGRELFGWTDRTGTRWKVCAILLGGYVKMFGDGDPASVNKSKSIKFERDELEVSFHHKRLSQRAAIVLAGPVANFLFAIVLLAGLYSIVGQRYAPPIIDRIEIGSAAESSGLAVGDEILQVNDQKIVKFNEIQLIVRPNAGKNLEFLIKRENKILPISVMPRAIESKDISGATVIHGLLGVGSTQVTFIRHNPIKSISLATKETWSIISQTITHVGEMIQGHRTTAELGGPLRIAKLSGTVAEAGLASLIWFMAVLSINLGLINLFPVPVLDGGHLFFYFIEFIRGKPLEPKAQEIASVTGLVLVVALMVFATWNDLVQMNVFNLIRSIF
jgi:regulator of sigma E protease